MRDTSTYVVAGVRWPSVTEVLKLAGLTDFSMVNPEVLENARLRGTAVHEWLEMVDLGFMEADAEPDEEIDGYISAYLRFKDETGFTPTAVEQKVRNDEYSYCGTLDRRGTMNGAEWLIDIKAVASVSAATALQTQGYAMCLSTPHKRAALQLFPTGKYKLYPYEERNDLHDWLSAVRVAHFKIRHGEKLQ